VPDEAERRILTAMLVTAIGLRLVVIAGLFASTDHASVPFGTFFGDEDYFIKRSIWLRNLALDVPISLADVRYAYDDAIQTSFVWMLAALRWKAKMPIGELKKPLLKFVIAAAIGGAAAWLTRWGLHDVAASAGLKGKMLALVSLCVGLATFVKLSRRGSR
jgi:hypothetical protein